MIVRFTSVFMIVILLFDGAKIVIFFVVTAQLIPFVRNFKKK